MHMLLNRLAVVSLSREDSLTPKTSHLKGRNNVRGGRSSRVALAAAQPFPARKLPKHNEGKVVMLRSPAED